MLASSSYWGSRLQPPGQVYSSSVGSGGKSSELPLTVDVRAGRAIPPQLRVVALSASLVRKKSLLSWLVGSLAFAAYFYDVLPCS